VVSLYAASLCWRCPLASLQEAPLEATLANLTAALQLPSGALALDSLSKSEAPTSELAVSSSSADKRRLLADDKAQAGPTYLTASISLDPDASAEGDSCQFSAAYMEAALSQAAAAQGASDPVRLVGGSTVQR